MNRKTYLSWVQEQTNKPQIQELAFLAPLAGMAIRGLASRALTGVATRALGSSVGQAAANVGGRIAGNVATDIAGKVLSRVGYSSTPGEVEKREPIVQEDGDDDELVRGDMPTGGKGRSRTLDPIALDIASNLSREGGAAPTQSSKTHVPQNDPYFTYKGGYSIFRPIGTMQENKLNKMVNTHVDKFLKTRHGSKLQKEVSEIATKKA
jgi:hypothetical protein